MPDSGPKEAAGPAVAPPGLTAVSFLGSSPSCSSEQSLHSLSLKQGGAKQNKAQKLTKLLQIGVQSFAEEVEQPDVDNLVPCGEVEGKNDTVLLESKYAILGCLAIHVKQCKNLTPRYTVRRNTWVLVRISINGLMKCTDLQLLTEEENGHRSDMVIPFENVKYFSIQVPRRASDEQNSIVLELVEVKSPKDFPKLLGCATVHLYEVIKRGHFSATCPMKMQNLVFCTVEVEFMFCYGCFGYGYSHQLKHPEMDLHRPLERSMFIRVPPSKDRTQPHSDTTAESVRYPSFLSPNLNMKDIHRNKEIPTVSDLSSKDVETLQTGPNELSPRTRLEKMINEYDSLKTWHEKEEYLDRLFAKKGPKRIAKQKAACHSEQTVEKQGHEENIPAFSDTSADEQLLARISEKESELEDGYPQSARYPEQILKTVAVNSFITNKHECSEEEILPIPAMSEASTFPEEKVVTNLDGKSSNNRGKFIDLEKENKLGSATEIKKTTKFGISKALHSTEASKTADTLKKSGETAKKLPLFLKEKGYQAAVPRKDKFEPFLGLVDRTQAVLLSERKEDEVVPLFTLLEEIEGREEEDQDPPVRTPLTEDVKNLHITLSENDRCQSLLSPGELDEEYQKLSLFNVKELLPLAIERDVFAIEQEQTYSETKIINLNSSLTKTLEESLIDIFINLIILKSVVGKSLEEVIKDRLSEVAVVTREVEEEYQNLQSMTGISPVLESSIYKGQNISRKRLPAEGQTVNLKSVVSQSLQDHPMERFFERGVIPGLELGKKHQDLSPQGIQEGSSVISETELAGRSCNFEERTSETDVVSLRYVLNQNQPDFPVERLIEMKLMEEVQLEKKHQHSFLPNVDMTQPKHEADFSDRRKENQSEMEISVIKALSCDLQDHSLQRFSETGLVQGTDTEYECQKIPLQSAKGTQLVDTAMDLPEREDSCEGNATKTEIINLKSPLPQNLQKYTLERLSETKLEKDSQNTSLDIINARLPLDVEMELPMVGQDHHQQKRSEMEVKSVSDKALQDTLIGRVLETEIMNLKPLLNEFLQHYLTEKLSRQMMEEKLRKVHQNLSSLNIREGELVAQETDLLEIDQVNCSENLAKQSIQEGKPALSESMQNFLLELLPEKEIMTLKSVLSKKIQDHLVERLAKIGLITEEELRKVKENLLLLRASRGQSKDRESGLLKEEQSSTLKSLLYPNLQDKPSETKHLESPTGKIPEDSKGSISETEVTSSQSILSNTLEDLQKENILETEIFNKIEEESDTERPQTDSDTETRNEKQDLPEDEFPDPVADVVVNVNNEKQTNSLMDFLKKIINTYEKENQDRKGEIAQSKKDFERPLSQEAHDEIETSEKVNFSSFSNACDAIIQTDLIEYPCRPQPSFPASCPRSVFLQAEPKEEKSSRNLDRKSRDKLCGKAPKKYAMPCHEHLGQILADTQCEKEKQTNLRKSREGVKEKHGKYSEPTPSASSAVGPKESKSSVFSHNKENLKQKAEQEKEHDNKPKKSFSKSVKALSDTAEQQPPQTVKTFKENSSPDGVPDPGSRFMPIPHEKGNLPNQASKEDTKMEVCKYLEKAVESALQDLRGTPEEFLCQPLHSARPHSVPSVCKSAKETSRTQSAGSSIASLDSSVSKDPGNTIRVKLENQKTQAEQVEISPKKRINFCEILEDTLLKNVTPKSDDK